ncbi:hypothetical protein QTP88_025423 [Uroleucon formosanum]
MTGNCTIILKKYVYYSGQVNLKNNFLDSTTSGSHSQMREKCYMLKNGGNKLLSASKNVAKSFADIEYISQLVYFLTVDELQQILEAIKHKAAGRKHTLQQRILNILKANTTESKVLKNMIVQIHNSRPQQPQQALDVQLPSCSQQPQNNLQMHSQSYTPPRSNSIPPLVETSSQAIEFEHLPFFRTVQTLLKPTHCQTNIGECDFTEQFYLTDNIRHSILKSWNIARQEYNIQIILRLLQVGLNENVTERLPYNITVSVNGLKCKLPKLNIPLLEEKIPWHCNVPIDITRQTNLKNCLPNTLKITWSKEPYEYMVGVFMTHRLTWNDLLVELKKRPVRASDKTKELVKISMENDSDMGVDCMITTIKDPLTKLRMKLPARGVDCIHLQCFDAIQFLQMNELKQNWTCPLCKKKIKFENIEVDEFFLDILQCPNLSEECESVVLLKDGSWSERKNGEVHALSDSDNSDVDNIDNDEINSKPKRFKYNTSKVGEFVKKSESVIETEDLTNSSESDHPLDLSLKNNSTSNASCSSNDEPIVILSDNSNSSTSTLNQEDKSRSVLCVITLD